MLWWWMYHINAWQPTTHIIMQNVNLIGSEYCIWLLPCCGCAISVVFTCGFRLYQVCHLKRNTLHYVDMSFCKVVPNCCSTLEHGFWRSLCAAIDLFDKSCGTCESVVGLLFVGCAETLFHSYNSSPLKRVYIHIVVLWNEPSRVQLCLWCKIVSKQISFQRGP